MPEIRTKFVLLLLPAVLVAGCSTAAAEWPTGVASGSSGSDPDTDPAQGGIPSGKDLTPFDTSYPAVSNLDPGLLKAVQQAATDARGRGIEFKVTSGWRSKAYQQRLLEEGIQKYGSLENARQYVNTPEKSTHVSGKAVDIGPTDADDWLIRHGDDYGLCQAYSNELWHFELLTTPGGTCPAPLPNAAG
ncbi:M15 family metallopeptidase [Amycolatopsis carbonis]|uniref:M15 family metallopeptidase n=1 Tax=Amycolatopsis carbonis TaxID=715471 RepID=A0A9Y2IKR1_9PSEU|nr:M15 family metallopeptidase [Amycolatopsis sp. 2-15]WIX81907.1 M15 family metallopeptidase [Amycolatopsis sp. 2-15]